MRALIRLSLMKRNRLDPIVQYQEKVQNVPKYKRLMAQSNFESGFKICLLKFLNLDQSRLKFFIDNFEQVQILKKSVPNFESGPVQISKKYIENFESGLVQILKKYITFFESGLVDILYRYF